MKDFTPIMLGRYQLHATWHDTLLAWEEALRNICELKNTYPSTLDAAIVELHQYAVKMDCSSRMTLRNRKFLP